MKLVRSIKEALTHMFDEEYQFLMNNLNEVKKLDLEEYVFLEEIKDFEIVSSFKELKYLNISGTGISDISPFKELKKLEILYADLCMITDISTLSQLKSLKELDLSAPMNYIKSLEPLVHLNNLEKLYVPDHSIKTIEPIYKLNQLKLLSIARTEVPNKEIDDFKKKHPNCEVWI